MSRLEPAIYTERDRRRWIEAGRQEGRREERAATLAYLRACIAPVLPGVLADEIERGEHVRPPRA